MKKKIRYFTERLDFSLTRKMPFFHQAESSECGLACLAMISSYYGLHKDLFSLRSRYMTPASGARLADVIQIAEDSGMLTRALSLEVSELKLLKLPCILHWDFNHFIVLVKTTKKDFIVHDPASGRLKLTRKEIEENFTGVALEIFPCSDYQERADDKAERIEITKLTKNIKHLTSNLLKIFFLSVVIEAIILLIPIGTQLTMDYVLPSADQSLLTLICTGLFIFILLRSLLSSVRAWLTLKIGSTIDVQWQMNLYKHLINIPLSYFERRKTGDVQSRFSSIETIRSTIVSGITGAIIDTIMCMILLLLMFLYSGLLSVIATGITAVYVIIRIVSYRFYKRLQEESLVKSARASSHFMETLYGISAVKAHGLKNGRVSQWINLKIDSINANLQISKVDMVYSGVNTFVSAVDQVTLLWVGANLVIHNEISLGMFIAFGTFRSQFSDRIASLTGYAFNYKLLDLHSERLSDIAMQKQEGETAHDAIIRHTEPSDPAELVVECISYSYNQFSRPVLKDISFTVEPGESVAIVGSSGSGKTTLMKLISGLIRPEKGRILIDRTDIHKSSSGKVNARLGCILQDDKLFSGSIRENITCFSEVPDEEWMIDCARKALIHDVIMTFPMGYDTLLGEVGEGLSGGQKQRVYIARALYKRPNILVMDEATSALDNVSEKLVSNSINSLRITKVIIAHRESTIAGADRIIRLDELNT